MPLVRCREEEGVGAAAGGDEETAGGEGQGDPQECKGDEPRPLVTARKTVKEWGAHSRAKP
jgi:hypothetical protein